MMQAVSDRDESPRMYAREATLRGGELDGVYSVTALSNDRVAYARAHTDLVVWHRTDGRVQTLTDDESQAVRALAVLPDGRIASGGHNAFYDEEEEVHMQMSVIKLWDLETGRCLQQMTGDHYYTNSIKCIAPLPDGRRLVSATDFMFEVWDLIQGRLRTLDYVQGCFVVLPDSRVIVKSVYDLEVLDLSEDNYQTTLTLTGQRESSVQCVTALADGCIVSGGINGTLRAWNLAHDVTGDRCLRVIEAHSSMVFCVAALSAGRVVSGGNYDDYTLKIWHVSSGRCLQTFDHTTTVICVAVLPCGRIVSGAEGDTMHVWSTRQQEIELSSAKQLGRQRANADVLKVITAFL